MIEFLEARKPNKISQVTSSGTIMLKTQITSLRGLYFVAKSYIYLLSLGGKQMNQNKLSFETEKLVVDYISFKFQHLDKSTLPHEYYNF